MYPVRHSLTFWQVYGPVPASCATCGQITRSWPPGRCAWCHAPRDTLGMPQYLLDVCYYQPDAQAKFLRALPHMRARGWEPRLVRHGLEPVPVWRFLLFSFLAYTAFRRRVMTVSYARIGQQWPPRLVLMSSSERPVAAKDAEST